jgi:hypothetical protein
VGGTDGPQAIVNGADVSFYVRRPGADPGHRAGGRGGARAARLAERYRLEFVDLAQFRIDHELFRAIPADLMLRYGFVPYRREGARW